MRKVLSKICYECKKDFKSKYGSKAEYKVRRFCSRECSNKGTAGANSQSKLGSKNPMYGKKPWNYHKFGVQKGRRGSENHFWKGGKVDSSRSDRTSGAWTKWRHAVYERDNYTCQICKIRGGNLVPHHIRLYRFYKSDRYKVENGLTLCASCHRGLHNRNINKKIINIYVKKT